MAHYDVQQAYDLKDEPRRPKSQEAGLIEMPRFKSDHTRAQVSDVYLHVALTLCVSCLALETLCR